jgi:hypothetical protein
MWMEYSTDIMAAICDGSSIDLEVLLLGALTSPSDRKKVVR